VATGDLVIGTDGNLALTVGPWAREKLHYIGRYCEIFNTGMKNRWPIRAYIDLFAGPGLCRVWTTREEILGSPLLALKSTTPFTHYYFNDLHAETLHALEERVRQYKLPNVQYFNTDCNSAVDELLDKLPSDSLDFCFIDPFKWEIKFDSIRKLTENRRMDLAITFHVGNIKRVTEQPPPELLAFFPDDRWLEEYRKARRERKHTGRVLLDAYKRGLTSLGYEAIKDYILQVNTKNVPLYHLIFASKSPRGADFWDKIAARSEAGQYRMPIEL
jgi:three-Cys-motif partner protein